MIEINPFILLSIAFLLSIIFTFLWNSLLKKIKSYLILKKFANGKKGEIRAKKYLLNKGFKIIAEQPSLKRSMFIDNKKIFYELRTDFIVKKNGNKSLVEVKTGKDATNPLSTNTRRQLFEYSQSYNIDKMYLLDADLMKMKEISFTPRKSKSLFFIYLFIFILGLILMLSPYLLKIIKSVLF